MFGLFVRQWVPLRKIKADSDTSLRSDLLRRIAELERMMIEERRECEGRIRGLEQQVDGLISMIRQFSQSSAMLMGDLKAGDVCTPASDARFLDEIDRVERERKKGE